jgi:hypothetical protein
MQRVTKALCELREPVDLLFQFCLGPGLKYTAAPGFDLLPFAASHSECLSIEREYDVEGYTMHLGTIT